MTFMCRLQKIWKASKKVKKQKGIYLHICFFLNLLILALLLLLWPWGAEIALATNFNFVWSTKQHTYFSFILDEFLMHIPSIIDENPCEVLYAWWLQNGSTIFDRAHFCPRFRWLTAIKTVSYWVYLRLRKFLPLKWNGKLKIKYFSGLKFWWVWKIA